MIRTLRYFPLLLLLVAGTVFAAGASYDDAKFDALMKEGKPVLVTIHAEWCPTCKVQEPIVSDLLKTPELAGMASLRVDFDKQKDAVRRFKAQYQSTLIVFKGGKEIGRSTGDTRKGSIAALLGKAI